MENENIRILRPFLRGLPLVILAMLISVLAAKKYLNYVTPMYESTAKLKLADTQEGVPSANLFKDFDVFASAHKINTEIEVLKSSNLLEKTLSTIPFSTEIYRRGDVQSVELFGNSPIMVESTLSSPNYFDKRFSLKIVSLKEFWLRLPNSTKKIKGSFGMPIQIDGGRIFITLNEKYIHSKPNLKILDDYEIEFLSKEKLLNKVNKNLDIVSVEKEVPVIRINFKSNVPEKAALFVNRLSEMYIKDYIESKYRAANISVDFLKKEIADANSRLSNAENKIQNYRDQHNIINIDQETETDLRKVSQLKLQQTNLKMSLDAVRYLNKYINNGKNNFLELAPNFEAFNDLLSTEMIKNIKKLQAEKKDLLLTYTPEHEKVKIIDTKINDLIYYQVESIKNTEKNLQVKLNDLNTEIASAQNSFYGLPEKEKMLNIMNREFNLYEKNYNFLNEKRIEAEIAKAAKISFHKIITPGNIPKEPVSPVRSIIIIVSAVLGMLAAVFLIYIIHFAKAKVNDVFIIEKNSNIPVAFTTPYIKDEKEIENRFLQSVFELELKGLLQNKNIIAITSYDKENHHCFHVKNLFNALLSQSRKVLLIDAVGNMENYFSKDVINVSADEGLKKTKNQLEILLKEKIENYDLCILNNQPVKKTKLSLFFMKLAHHNLFVLDSRKTPKKRILDVEVIKEEYQIPNLWFVLNKQGYNPSIIKIVYQFFGDIKKKK